MIDADNLVEVFNTTIDIKEPGQKVRFSGGDIRFGKASTDEFSDPVQLGSQVTSVDRIEFDATGLIEIGSGSVIATSAANSLIDLHAGSLEIAGSLLAGATVVGSDITFGGVSADITITAQDTVELGGTGIIGGVSQTVGGTLKATGAIAITVSGGTADVSFTMNPFSAFFTQTADNEPANTPHSITIDAAQNVHVLGTIEALQDGADITITSGELLLVDGFVKADDQLTLTGGSDETGVGLMVQPFLFDVGGARVQGGTLTTNVGGAITLAATQKMVLGGVIGEVDVHTGVADATSISVTQAGDLMVTGLVKAADSISIQVTNIAISPDAVIQTLVTGGEVDLRATGNFIIGTATSRHATGAH